jgi:ankyrin repeat protein
VSKSIKAKLLANYFFFFLQPRRRFMPRSILRLKESKMADLNALIEAARKNDVAAIQSLLAEHPDLASARTDSGDSALLQAAYYGSKDAVGALRRACPEISPFEAAAVGDLAAVEKAVAADPAAISAYSHDGWTLLHLAAFFGHADMVDYLLGFQPDLTGPSKNPMNVNPLQSALANGHQGIALKLIDGGAPINEPEGGWTPLHYAAYNNLSEIAQILLERGADPQAKTAEGKTPLDFAREKGNSEVASLLENVGPVL